MSDGTQRSRSLALDALRGAAILLVIAHHSVVPVAQAGRVRPVAALLVTFGWTGVDLFFVLSGFLIGGLLLEELSERSGIAVGRFLLRRAFKIWPAYYAYLAYVFLFTAFLHDRDRGAIVVAQGLLPNLVHLQNYLGTPRVHTWSLAVEEHFYLALPLLLVGLHGLRMSARSITRTLAVLILGLATLRVVHVLSSPPGTAYFATHLRIDSLLFGVLLAHARRSSAAFRDWIGAHRAALRWSGLALVFPMALISKDTAFVEAIGFILLYLGYGAILLSCLAAPPGREASPWGGLWRGLARVGAFSYPIYLWFEDLGRTPVGFALGRGLLRSWPPELRWIAAQTLYSACAVAAGVLMSLLVEAPFLRLRDRWLPRRGSGAVPGAIALSSEAVRSR